MSKRRKRVSNKKTKKERLVPILPNIITTASLSLGLASIMTSIQIVFLISSGGGYTDEVFKKLWWASSFIAISVVMDMLDGKLARALGSESDFGLSYDSLSDLISFGVAPGVLVYVWILMDSGKLGLMALLIYVVCAALRLARFNVQSSDVEKYSFSGLPSPMAAGLMFAPVMLFSEFSILPGDKTVWFYLVSAPVAGLVMVSDIPYRKFPRSGVKGQFNLLVVAAIIIAAVISNPGIIVTSVVYIYFIFGIAVYLSKYLLKDSSEETESDLLKQEL